MKKKIIIAAAAVLVAAGIVAAVCFLTGGTYVNASPYVPLYEKSTMWGSKIGLAYGDKVSVLEEKEIPYIINGEKKNILVCLVEKDGIKGWIYKDLLTSNSVMRQFPEGKIVNIVRYTSPVSDPYTGVSINGGSHDAETYTIYAEQKERGHFFEYQIDDGPDLSKSTNYHNNNDVASFQGRWFTIKDSDGKMAMIFGNYPEDITDAKDESSKLPEIDTGKYMGEWSSPENGTLMLNADGTYVRSYQDTAKGKWIFDKKTNRFLLGAYSGFNETEAPTENSFFSYIQVQDGSTPMQIELVRPDIDAVFRYSR